MFSLSEMTKLVKSRKRVGRGGGRGKTSGRGNKGQLSRSGGRSAIKPSFEGGQMPLHRRMPRRGFHSLKKKTDYPEIIHLKDVLALFKAGETVDYTTLVEKGLLRKSVSLSKVKILGKDTVSAALSIKVNAISAGARSAVEGAGGSVEICS